MITTLGFIHSCMLWSSTMNKELEEIVEITGKELENHEETAEVTVFVANDGSITNEITGNQILRSGDVTYDFYLWLEKNELLSDTDDEQVVRLIGDVLCDLDVHNEITAEESTDIYDVVILRYKNYQIENKAMRTLLEIAMLAEEKSIYEGNASKVWEAIKTIFSKVSSY